MNPILYSRITWKINIDNNRTENLN